MDKFSAIIIEDSESTVELIAQCFEELENVDLLGYAVNGKDGYDAIKEHNPDIITLDINMPVMDGLELLEKIREEKLPIKILVVSGVLDDETLKKVKELRPDGFLEKPFQPAFVRDNIKNILSPTEDLTSSDKEIAQEKQENDKEKPDSQNKKWRNDDGSFEISFEPSEFDFQYNGEIKEFKPLKVSGTVKGKRIPVKDTQTKRVKEKDLIYKPHLEEPEEFKTPESSQNVQEEKSEVQENPEKSYKIPTIENSHELSKDEFEVVKNPKEENTEADLLEEFFGDENGIKTKDDETPEKNLKLTQEKDLEKTFNISNNDESEYVENKNIKEIPDNDEIEFNIDDEYNEEFTFDLDENIDKEDLKETDEFLEQEKDDSEDIEFVLDDDEDEPDEEVLESDFEEKFDAYLADLQREKDNMSSIAASQTVINDRDSLFNAPINVGLEKEISQKTTENIEEDIFEEEKIEVAIKPPRIDFNKFNVKEKAEKKYDKVPELIDGAEPIEEKEENFIDKVTNKAQGLFDKVQSWLKE